MTSYSLFELNEYIKRVMALNFSDSIWVNCEISQVKESRGNVYLDIIEQKDDTDEVIAQANAVIWYKSYLFIRKKLGDLLPSILQDGTKVLIRVKVEFHERFGMKLVIEDIDPSYTIGQMEMARQKIIERLKNEGIFDDNRIEKLPIVLQRIAVISSPTAAGYADFINHLQSNEYGYEYEIDFYKAAMQGQNTEREVCAAFEEIKEKQPDYDCVVLIRGGGSKLDLGSFDNYNIGHKIATFPIPVLTGIGHEIDNTVADAVSHTPFKTPTAVASFLIDHNMQYEANMIEMIRHIEQHTRYVIENNNLKLQQLEQMLHTKSKELITKSELNLVQSKTLIYQALKFNIKRLGEKMEYSETVLALSNPITNLKKGYSIIKRNGEVVSSKNTIKPEDHLEIEFHDGKTTIVVDKKQ